MASGWCQKYSYIFFNFECIFLYRMFVIRVRMFVIRNRISVIRIRISVIRMFIREFHFVFELNANVQIFKLRMQITNPKHECESRTRNTNSNREPETRMRIANPKHELESRMPNTIDNYGRRTRVTSTGIKHDFLFMQIKLWWKPAYNLVPGACVHQKVGHLGFWKK